MGQHTGPRPRAPAGFSPDGNKSNKMERAGGPARQAGNLSERRSTRRSRRFAGHPAFDDLLFRGGDKGHPAGGHGLAFQPTLHPFRSTYPPKRTATGLARTNSPRAAQEGRAASCSTPPKRGRASRRAWMASCPRNTLGRSCHSDSDPNANPRHPAGARVVSGDDRPPATSFRVQRGTSCFINGSPTSATLYPEGGLFGGRRTASDNSPRRWDKTMFRATQVRGFGVSATTGKREHFRLRGGFACFVFASTNIRFRLIGRSGPARPHVAGFLVGGPPGRCPSGRGQVEASFLAVAHQTFGRPHRWPVRSTLRPRTPKRWLLVARPLADAYETSRGRCGSGEG